MSDISSIHATSSPESQSSSGHGAPAAPSIAQIQSGMNAAAAAVNTSAAAVAGAVLGVTTGPPMVFGQSGGSQGGTSLKNKEGPAVQDLAKMEPMEKTARREDTRS